jgi:hypothetical protein
LRVFSASLRFKSLSAAILRRAIETIVSIDNTVLVGSVFFHPHAVQTISSLASLLPKMISVLALHVGHFAGWCVNLMTESPFYAGGVGGAVRLWVEQVKAVGDKMHPALAVVFDVTG